MNRKDIGFDLKAVSDTGVFSGYGSVYGVVDDGEDVVSPGCFTESLSDWAKKGRMPALLWQHSSREPIGAYTKIAEDCDGPVRRGQAGPEDPARRGSVRVAADEGPVGPFHRLHHARGQL
jgi:HK97 family phage prohead protease